MPESGDEERSLMGDPKQTYGIHSSAASRQSARRSWRQVPSGYSSRAGSDSEDYEPYGNSSRPKRPPLSALSSFINSRHLDTPNLVLPALDPRAEEVKASMNIKRSLEQMLLRKSHQVNLSTVRSKYRFSRKKARDGKLDTRSLYDRARIFFNDYSRPLKRILFAKNAIVLFVYLDLLVDIMFCTAYLVELKQEKDVGIPPPWLYKYRAWDLWIFCQFLSFWDIGSFLMRVLLAGDKWHVVFSARSVIEVSTTLPFVISMFIENGQYLYNKPFNPVKGKLIQLVCTLLVLIFNGVSAFRYVEVTFGNQDLSLVDTLYFVMVVMSTVGFGDITPQTEAGRIVIVLLILCSVAVLPSLITGVVDTIYKQQAGGGHFVPGGYPFILLVGTFTAEQAADILDGFFGMGDNHINVVFLDTRPPTDELKAMERNSMWGHRARFLCGSAMQARYAKAIFTVSDRKALDPLKEDERNTTRLWSLYCYTADHNIPIYSCNLSPSTGLYQKVATEVICVREFKHYLLALNVRCRGASTLITNLLHQRQPFNEYDEPWQAQFDDGASNEIYTAPPADAIVGLPFSRATWLLFKECQVILFAIKTLDVTTGSYEVILNPRKHVIQANDLCVYIAESIREVRDVNQLSPEFVNDTVKGLEHAMPSDFTLGPPLVSSTSSMPSTPSTSTESVKKQAFRVGKLTSRKHSLLTCKRLSSIAFETDAQSGSSAMADSQILSCYMLETPSRFEDMLISNAENMRSHVVVCLHREVPNLFRFIQNLRAPNIPRNELQDIVLLCQSRPRSRVYELINIFPRVYFMIGNCRHPDDLLRAGVKGARQVVIMSENEIPEQNEANPDSAAIMTSHVVDLLLQPRQPSSYNIVNLIEKSNIRYMHLLQERDLSFDVVDSSAFAAGDVVVENLLSHVLLSQVYYQPDIVAIIKTLCGMGESSSGNSQFAPYLASIQIPDEYVNKSFAELFESLLLRQGVISIGILRAPDINFGNDLPFVYTNPVPSLILKETDNIYILTAGKKPPVVL
ncbi:hypothetical protein INT44_000446 [Umbelopsis vinacea]|uniref:Uncharacterized protein n=1 Tax=Umbelopsis vinacea TaxID=44442 RepID=A0A8H7PL31_9FUNG|nr:hypothetical protein INT44_000446 [Umbelopsis vinacea]